MLGLGAVLALAGSVDALVAHRPAWMGRWPTALAIAAASLPLVQQARQAADDFLPCSSMVLAGDASGSEWIVPAEVRTWLAAKAERCAQDLPIPPLTDVPLVSWGVYRDEAIGQPEGSRWTSDHAVFLLPVSRTEWSVGFRRPRSTPAHPTRVVISTNGRAVVATLVSDEWTFVTIPLDPDVLTFLRDAHRVDVAVDPWFVPAAVDPGASDLRRFGVQMRTVAER